MSIATEYPHVTMRPDGTVHVGKTRYKVIHLAGEHYHYGWTAEEILRQHPDLRPEQVYSALTYFYDHYDEMVSAMKASAAAADQLAPQPFSREELLHRKAARGD